MSSIGEFNCWSNWRRRGGEREEERKGKRRGEKGKEKRGKRDDHKVWTLLKLTSSKLSTLSFVCNNVDDFLIAVLFSDKILIKLDF